ncbi:MAG: hypothetical protein FD135_3386 [Comamonadaceae bacterium]|nr:MAG: hypothetical protein FD135_3386 [Comamonadaceae bacterium]
MGWGKRERAVTDREAMLLHHAPKQITKRYKLNSFLRLMNKG